MLIRTRSKEEKNPKNKFVFRIYVEHGDADFTTEEDFETENPVIAECYMRFWDSVDMLNLNYYDSDSEIEKHMNIFEKYYHEEFGMTPHEYYKANYDNDEAYKRYHQSDLFSWIYGDLSENGFCFYDPRDAIDFFGHVSYDVCWYDENEIKYDVKLGKEDF